MAFNVNAFRTHFAKHNDFAKTSKFDVRITAPPGLNLDATDLRFQCESTELPGYTVNTVEGRYYGVANPVASFPAFADLTLNFICAGDFWEKKLFDRWMNLVIPINNYNPNYKDVYTSPKIEINQFSEIAGEAAPAGKPTTGPAGFNIEGLASGATFPSSGQNTPGSVSAPVIYKVSFFGAFPTAIAPMSINWGDDGIHRLAVTFRYEYWITGDLEQIATPMPMAPPTPPRTQNNKPAPASGSSPPVVDNRPTTVPQTVRPVQPVKGRGGTFAGGGATGGW